LKSRLAAARFALRRSVVIHSGWYIAVGENASRADVVASDRLEAFFKGLGVEMKIRRVSGSPYPEGDVVIAGTAETNAWLRELAAEGKIDIRTSTCNYSGIRRIR
jgi:hypothetical protein